MFNENENNDQELRPQEENISTKDPYEDLGMYSEYGEYIEDEPIAPLRPHPHSMDMGLVEHPARDMSAPTEETAAETTETENANNISADIYGTDDYPYSEYGEYLDAPEPLPSAAPAAPIVPEIQEAELDDIDEETAAAETNFMGLMPAAAIITPEAREKEPPKQQQTPNPVPTVIRRGGRGRRVWAGILYAFLAMALGIVGGFLAAELRTDRMIENMEANFDRILQEQGGVVMYRSVNTTPGEVNSIIDAAAVTELCADTVVELSTSATVESWGIFGYSEGTQEGAGSGIIISGNGYILTCAHVVNDVDSITVTLRNGEQYPAQIIGLDAASDVAVIKIEPQEELSVAVMGDSSAMTVGSGVVAIGNPLGNLGGSVTAGILSATDRTVSVQMDNEIYKFNVMQTDAAINGGNSGGGLFNAKGELIGLVNSKSESIGVEGLAFALPINDIKTIIEDILNYGYNTNAAVYLGIQMLDIENQRTATNYRVDELGCYILEIKENSNAAYAGLQSGDRIVSINDTQISKGEEVANIISQCVPNEVLEIVISRNGQYITIPVTLYTVVPESMF